MENKYYVAKVVDDKATQLTKPMTGRHAHAAANYLSLDNAYRNTRYMAVSAECEPTFKNIKSLVELVGSDFIEDLL